MEGGTECQTLGSEIRAVHVWVGVLGEGQPCSFSCQEMPNIREGKLPKLQHAEVHGPQIAPQRLSVPEDGVGSNLERGLTGEQVSTGCKSVGSHT